MPSTSPPPVRLLEVAKQVATASVISEGRVSLAVGVGWMREEFDLLGQDFGNRGKRLDEMIPALRALWQGGWVSWNGRYYQVPELMLEPHPSSPVPILCGGESEVALRRAARLCDGWVGTAYAWDDAVGYVQKLTALRREYGRQSEPFEIMLALLELPSVDLYRRAEDLGITAVMCAPVGRSPRTPSATARRSSGSPRPSSKSSASGYILCGTSLTRPPSITNSAPVA